MNEISVILKLTLQLKWYRGTMDHSSLDRNTIPGRTHTLTPLTVTAAAQHACPEADSDSRRPRPGPGTGRLRVRPGSECRADRDRQTDK
jgi:hypothetical protein